MCNKRGQLGDQRTFIDGSQHFNILRRGPQTVFKKDFTIKGLETKHDKQLSVAGVEANYFKSHDELDLRSKILSLCSDVLGGKWADLHPENVSISHVRGGLTNLVYLVSRKKFSSSDDQPSTVLLRVQSQTDHEKLLNELVVFTSLAENGLGPKLLGIFPGGRFEEYIPSRHVDHHEVTDSNTSKSADPSTAEEISLNGNDKESLSLNLVDFEFSAYNYRGFDLANYFCAAAIEHNLDDYPRYRIDLNQLHNRSMKVEFCKEYVREARKFLAQQLALRHHQVTTVKPILIPEEPRLVKPKLHLVKEKTLKNLLPRELSDALQRAGDVIPWKDEYEEEANDEVYWRAHNASCYKMLNSNLMDTLRKESIDVAIVYAGNPCQLAITHVLAIPVIYFDLEGISFASTQGTQRFTKAAKEMSKDFRARPSTPFETALHYIELVGRHRGSDMRDGPNGRMTQEVDL
ncbi:Choline/ethanolamine kinase [Teladorsagia circumcincta]|uniref:Choline/ethanolamine kinase n=1 Tax=Teladorsagia circumcincta TaxID=45464 RepID=A0A2G9UE87_TELCI|nr:Choline/ethanolamine kinase [Teladorsagia circumcincta]